VAQGDWLLSRFPHGVFENVPGLCKAVTQQEIADNDYSLTPGRYVGVAVGNVDGDEGKVFTARMREIHENLSELNDTATELASKIQAAFAEIVE
jgi:type I restriction enzyme M protein